MMSRHLLILFHHLLILSPVDVLRARVRSTGIEEAEFKVRAHHPLFLFHCLMVVLNHLLFLFHYLLFLFHHLLTSRLV